MNVLERPVWFVRYGPILYIAAVLVYLLATGKLQRHIRYQRPEYAAPRAMFEEFKRQMEEEDGEKSHRNARLVSY